MNRPDDEWHQAARECLHRARERRAAPRPRVRNRLSRPLLRLRDRLSLRALLRPLIAVAACAAAAIGLNGAGLSPQPEPERTLAANGWVGLANRESNRGPEPVPRRRDVRRAERFARSQAGLVSFAVIDSSRRLYAFRGRELFPMASIAKAPLLAARLRGLRRSDEPLTEAERDRLAAMIRWSDNDAADAVYAAVGDRGMFEVADRGGMKRFTVAGHWGNAQHTAPDAARFMWNLRRALEPRHRRFALGLLAGIVPEQRWGIPQAARVWDVWFKGGWTDTRRGELVSQAALLERRGRRIALAILTDAQSSQEQGREALQGIADRLLKPGRR